MSAPTETSPLIPKPDQNHHVDPSNGIFPGGAEIYDERDESSVEVGDGGDVERQISNGDTVKHQGMPDVKEKMKYIFPAIAIGVSEQQLLSIMKKLNDSDIPCSCGSNSCGLNIWSHWIGFACALVNVLDCYWVFPPIFLICKWLTKRCKLLPYADSFSTCLRKAL